MIKLALLLRHPTDDAALDPELRAALEGCGLEVTGCGRASVSVRASPAVCAKLFGQIPHADAALPIPAPLAPSVSLITVTPPHAAMIPPE